MILGIDVGARTFGWAVVTERPGPIEVLELGELFQPDVDGKGGAPNAIRVHVQALLVDRMVTSHGITTIAAEARSIGGHPGARVSMAAAQSSCWGMLAGVAALRGAELVEVAPKVWQGAVVGLSSGRASKASKVDRASKAIDYGRVSAALASYVTGQAREQLAAIPASRRNHALDACGVGILRAVRPQLASLIARAPRERSEGVR